MASPRSKDQSSGSLSFTDVAQARGKSWADQKLADVHRIERMQAAEIVSLKNDVETVRSKARAAEAMAEELRQKLKAAQMERDLAAESRRPTRELAFAQPAVAAPLSSDADPEQISDMRERSASLEASLRASTEVAEQERVQRLDLSRQLGEARAELQRLRGKYEQRLASSAALQRQMETEAETARARLASAGARADAAAGEGARAARAMADGEAGDLRAQIVLLQQEKQNWARERETLTRERAALEAKLSGLSGKIKGVHQSIAASEAQVTAEERHLAALLREMKVEAREHDRAAARVAEEENRAAETQRRAEARAQRSRAAAVTCGGPGCGVGAGAGGGAGGGCTGGSGAGGACCADIGGGGGSGSGGGGVARSRQPHSVGGGCASAVREGAGRGVGGRRGVARLRAGAIDGALTPGAPPRPSALSDGSLSGPAAKVHGRARCMAVMDGDAREARANLDALRRRVAAKIAGGEV